MAFPDDVYQYDSDTTRQPLTTLLGIYKAGADSPYTVYRSNLINVAISHGDITSSDTTFYAFINSTALSLGYVVLSGSDYIWTV